MSNGERDTRTEPGTYGFELPLLLFAGFRSIIDVPGWFGA